MKKIKTDFISVAVNAQEKYGEKNELVDIEICKELKKEINRLSPEEMATVLKSTNVNVKDMTQEITLAFPM
nr:hypothetical protein [uncultured Cellulosilyticum sp.]